MPRFVAPTRKRGQLVNDEHTACGAGYGLPVRSSGGKAAQPACAAVPFTGKTCGNNRPAVNCKRGSSERANGDTVGGLGTSLLASIRTARKSIAMPIHEDAPAAIALFSQSDPRWPCRPSCGATSRIKLRSRPRGVRSRPAAGPTPALQQLGRLPTRQGRKGGPRSHVHKAKAGDRELACPPYLPQQLVWAIASVDRRDAA